MFKKFHHINGETIIKRRSRFTGFVSSPLDDPEKKKI